MKNKALYGLLSGVSLIVATLIGVGVLMPSAESATNHVEASLVACAHVRVTSESGYGIKLPGTCAKAE